MQNAQSKMQNYFMNAQCRMQTAGECRMQNAKQQMNAQCRMQNAKLWCAFGTYLKDISDRQNNCRCCQNSQNANFNRREATPQFCILHFAFCI